MCLFSVAHLLTAHLPMLLTPLTCPVSCHSCPQASGHPLWRPFSSSFSQASPSTDPFLPQKSSVCGLQTQAIATLTPVGCHEGPALSAAPHITSAQRGQSLPLLRDQLQDCRAKSRVPHIKWHHIPMLPTHFVLCTLTFARLLTMPVQHDLRK